MDNGFLAVSEVFFFFTDTHGMYLLSFRTSMILVYR